MAESGLFNRISPSENALKNIKRGLSDVIKASKKLNKISPLKILEDPENSLVWLVDNSGNQIRKICGGKTTHGPCMLTAGHGTDHPGFGKCKKHSSSALLNPVLSAAHNYPARFVELLEHVDNLEDNDLINVDHEIKILTALQQYLLVVDDPEERLTPYQIEQIQSLTMDIVKAKSIRNKISRELRLDNTTIKDFVHQIFTIIVKNFPGVEGKILIESILNEVIVPFKSRDRITPGEFEMGSNIKGKIDKIGGKDESN